MTGKILEGIPKSSIEQLISKDTQLPSLPSGLPQLLKSFAFENITNKKLAEAISYFPSIAARLIFLANSAWSAPRIPIENLEMACVRLGLSVVRSVSLALCIAKLFNTNRCRAFDGERFWSSALLAADGAAWLTSSIQAADAPDPKTIHTAGLLHNLGLLWLADTWPNETSGALEATAADESLSAMEALREKTGTDYCEVGGVLGRAWILPDILVNAMEFHCNPSSNEPEFPSTMLVGYAAKMVSALYWDEDERPLFADEKRFNFDPSDLDEVYLKLAGKMEENRELAKLMFSNA